MKFLKIILMLGMVVPLQGMQRFLPAMRCAAAAYKNKLQSPVHHLHDLAQIKGAYLLGAKTPLIGHLTDLKINDVAHYRSMLAEGLQADRGYRNVTPILQSLFYQNPVDQKISVTQNDKSVVRALPPTGIAYLLYNYSLPADKTKDDALIEQWYQKYATLQDQINEPFSRGSFGKKARQFLKNFRTMAQTIKPEQLSSILLTVLFKNAYDKKDLQEFATECGVTLPAESYTEEDFLAFEEKFQKKEFHSLSCQEFEQFLYWFSVKQGSRVAAYNTELLKAPSVSCGYKGQPARALCVEESIRTFFNTLLYNPDTKQLDISLLPSKIQSSCDHKLVQFIQKYKTLEKNVQKDTESAQDFLDLVSDKPGILYYQGKNYELDSCLKNTLNLLKYLFGLPTIKSYKELGDELCTDTRTITFTEDVANRKVTFGIYKKDEKIFMIELALCLDSGHAFSVFTRDDNFSFNAKSTIQNNTHSIHHDLLSFSPWVFSSHDFKTIAPDAFKELIEQNDFIIDKYFIQKMLSLLYDKDSINREVIFNILMDNFDLLNVKSLYEWTIRSFFKKAFEELDDQNLSLRIAEKLVAQGYHFSAYDISYSIISKNKDKVLPFCLEHAEDDISSIDHVAIALQYNASGCLKILIDKGFVSDKVSLFYKAFDYKSASCLAVLIENDPNLLKTKHPKSGESPLNYAIYQSRFNYEYYKSGIVFKVLIDAGADMYEIDKKTGKTLLYKMKTSCYDKAFLEYLKSKENIFKLLSTYFN